MPDRLAPDKDRPDANVLVKSREVGIHSLGDPALGCKSHDPGRGGGRLFDGVGLMEASVLTELFLCVIMKKQNRSFREVEKYVFGNAYQIEGAW